MKVALSLPEHVGAGLREGNHRVLSGTLFVRAVGRASVHVTLQPIMGSAARAASPQLVFRGEPDPHIKLANGRATRDMPFMRT